MAAPAQTFNVNFKRGFFPIVEAERAHGLFYVNRLGQLHFEPFVIDDYAFNDLTTYPPQGDFTMILTLKEECLIVGMMLDFNIINSYQDFNEFYEFLKPIEKYLFQSSNLVFKVPDGEYRNQGTQIIFTYSK